jgi:hypothetical protein
MCRFRQQRHQQVVGINARTCDPSAIRREAAVADACIPVARGIRVEMTDSERTQPETPDAPVERPSWRFSGRRGTPVHMRERTPATLPPEIKQMVAQMAREHAGEQQAEASAQAKPAPARRAATSTLRLPHDEARQSPPVAAAPMPVERRTRTEASDAVVSTTPAEAVPAPEELPVSSEVAALAADEPIVPESPAPVAEAAPENQRDAKARAKARAKAEREAAEQAEGKRRLFAAGRVVDPEVEDVAVEPIVAEVEPIAVAEPSVDTAPEPARVVATGEYLIEAPEDPAATSDAPSIAPEPAIALEAATQAAWELGRLPFLLPQSAFDEPSTPEPAGTPAAAADEPIVELDIPRARTEQPELLHPIAWAPVDRDPAPAPLDADVPRRSAPSEIAALGEPLHVPRREPSERLSSRAGTRVEQGHGRGTLDSADARRRVVERRAQLDQVVAELAALASRHAD